MTSLTATPGNGQVSLTWAAVEGASSYNVYWEEVTTGRSVGRVSDCSGDRIEGITGTSYTHTGLNNGASYRYRVTAVGGNGQEGSCGNGGGGSGEDTEDGVTSVTPGVTPTPTPTPRPVRPTPTPTTTPMPVPGDTTPPTTTVALAESAVAPTSWSGTATINENGTGYCVAVPNGSASPTAAQIKSGSGGSIVGTRGTVAMTANTTATCQVTGLTGLTPYDFYFVAQDGSNNLQSDGNVSGPVSASTVGALLTDTTLFPDAAFRGCLQGTGQTYAEQIVGGLDCSMSWISDITGAEYLTNANLTALYLDDNNIVDVSPLAGLTNLTTLDLGFNRIVDVSPLAGLTNLTTLGLSYNSIVDVSGLASLTNLTGLYLSGNSIVDVSPLAGLTNLTGLYLSGNSIVDVSGLAGLTNLTGLHLQSNSIVDVSVLAGLTSLTYLNAYENSIVNVSGLAGLTNLTTLYLKINSIVDVSPLAGLTNLTGLDLGSNSIVDVSGLAGLTNLTWLFLNNNSIGGQGVGNVHQLVSLVAADIYLGANVGQSCAEAQTLITTLGTAVDISGNGINNLDTPADGVNCTNQ